MKHFELTDEYRFINNETKVFRIRCTKTFNKAKAGDMGGFIEKEENLSGETQVFGDARVSGDARGSGNAQVFGDARVFGDAQVFGDARVFSCRDYCCFQPVGREHDALTTFRERSGGIKVSRGCFTGSLQDFL
jgi:hypothetical protein